MLGHAIVKQGKVALHDIGDRMIAGDQFAQKRLGLARHGKAQVGFVFRIQRAIGHGEIHLAQVQPRLGEVGDETAEAGVLQQPLGLGAEVGAQFAGASEREQFGIRRGAREEIG